MRLIESFKKRKLILLNIFLTLYIGINLIGGERGLISYIEKKKTYNELVEKEGNLKKKIKKRSSNTMYWWWHGHLNNH